MVKRRRSPSQDTVLQDAVPANDDPAVSRREFLGMTAASLLMAGSLRGDTKPDTKNGLPYRTLGRTGEKISLIGLGGYHLGNQSDPNESIRIIRTGIDEGINFLAGTTTAERAKFEWAKRCAMVIARRPF
jgi:hypothetical protein